MEEPVEHQNVRSRLEPEGLSVTETEQVSGLGKTKLYEAIKTGRLKAHKFGKRTIILPHELREFLASLPTVV
jgi:excisionase family DNA binding protein